MAPRKKKRAIKQDTASSHDTILHKLTHIEVTLKDIVQVIVGASVLAVPVAFTEETWRLGGELAMRNVLSLMFLSLAFIFIFVFYNYYHHHIRGYTTEYFKRVLTTYVLAFLVVSLILVIIQKAPWAVDPVLAFKRTVIVTFPASMSAAIADTFK
jgi:uncharacterized membrane protein